MSSAGRTAESVQAVEALMLEHFRTEPFHNLHLIYGPRLESAVPGGTCSDKTLSFVAAGLRAGFDVSLHSGFIGGREIHRLARVRIRGRQFFADIGNGWPALQLYPADREISFRCFGMGFRTEIADGRLSVFHEKRGRESLQLEIDVCGRPESEIRADIEGRFNSGVVYPFSNSLRFSLVVGDRFLFLRGDRLEIYDDRGFECLEGIDDARVPDVLHEHFGYDVGALLRDDNIGTQADRQQEDPEKSDGHAAPAVHGSEGGSTTTQDRSEGGRIPRTVLVTGAAGFIGFHTALRLLRRGDRVVGFDNLNDYYDVTLKEDRLRELEAHAGFTSVRANLVDAEAVAAVFRSFDIRLVVHLAAQVGVRASVEIPRAYVDSNVVGFLNVLECCRHHSVQHMVYASSSSVYGGNTAVPYSVHDRVDHPLSLYAATKRSNELMAHSYSHLFGLPTTGLRFFTVYGPWGRPDMALFLFAHAIVEGRPIDVFNNGDMVRDFTFVDDVVEGVVRALDRVPRPDEDWRSDAPDPASSSAPYRLYNVGNDSPVRLLDVIEELEAALGRKAQTKLLPQQPGDMRVTHADVDDLHRDVGYRPTTDLRSGIRAFVDWFCDYYEVRP